VPRSGEPAHGVGVATPLPAGIAQVVRRAVVLRCPRCGRTPLYTGWFAMHEGCAVCGLRYEREPGYFVGAIYVNYAVTIVVAAGTVLVLDWTIGLTLAQQLAIGIALGALVPVVFFRYARSVWLSLGYLVTRADERHRPERLPRR
jgi:uncharacterized protein (DUF983 family)